MLKFAGNFLANIIARINIIIFQVANSNDTKKFIQWQFN